MRNIKKTRRSLHWYNVECGSTKHIDDGTESLEQITEAIDCGTENINVQNMNSRNKENIAGNINDNVRRGTNDGKLWNGLICTQQYRLKISYESSQKHGYAQQRNACKCFMTMILTRRKFRKEPFT